MRRKPRNEIDGQFTGCDDDRMWTRLLVFATVLTLAGCQFSSDTLNLTGGERSMCQVHNKKMTVAKVKLTYGLPSQTPLTMARVRQFPHAEEPRNMGCCMRSQKFGRTYVCPDCSTAREAWLATNQTPIEDSDPDAEPAEK